MARNLLDLSSIAECMRAAEYLAEAGEPEGADIGLRGEACSSAGARRNAWPGFAGHRLAVRDGSTMVCRDCGKTFHTRCQGLTAAERIVFATLDPKCPFEQRFGR